MYALDAPLQLHHRAHVRHLPGARAGSDAHVRRAWLTCGQQQCSRARSAAHVRAAIFTCGQRCSRADSDARVRAAILACEKRCSRAGSCAPRRPNSTLRHPRRATRGGHHSAAAAGLTAVWRGWRSRAAGRQRARQGGAARGARRARESVLHDPTSDQNVLVLIRSRPAPRGKDLPRDGGGQGPQGPGVGSGPSA